MPSSGDESNARLYAELERSLALCKIAEIELALKEAIKDSSSNTTTQTQTDRRRGGESSASSSTHTSRELDQGGVRENSLSSAAASRSSSSSFEEERRIRIGQLSEQEKVKIYTDIYGRKPQREMAMDHHRDKLEHELGQIPPDRKAALLKAQRAYPLLFYTAAHTDLFLQATGYDPKLAAVRVVNYWEKRLHLFGDRAFSPESFNKPTADDYLRMYNSSVNAVSDTNTDEVTREIARGWLNDWKKTKTANLDKFIQKMSPHDMAALIEAKEKTANRDLSDDHKLLFLQCVDFQEELAASRMVRYWNAARKIFGDDAFRPITLEILEDRSSEIQSGFIWLLPGLDAHGRKLFYLTHSALPREEGDYSSVGHEMALWYTVHAALEDEMVRSNGSVLIIDHKNATYNENLVVRLTALMGIMPIKVKAIHGINPPSGWLEYLSSIIDEWCLEGSRNVNERHVVHAGSDENIVLGLGEFGISKDQLPVMIGGSVECEYWEEWLKGRRDAGK